MLPFIPDLIIAGSPCQSFSNLGNMEGFEGSSGLFYHFLRILKEAKKLNPDLKFLLENVRMKQAWKDAISLSLGVKPVMLDAITVTPQYRKRLYWTNIPNNLYYSLDIINKTVLHILEEVSTNHYNIKLNTVEYWKKNNTLERRYATVDSKHAICLTARMYANWNGNYIRRSDGHIRRLTPKECERLQTLPDDYTNVPGVPERERYKMIGNGWVIDILTAFFRNLK